MRIVLRLVFLAMVAAGIAAGFVYPSLGERRAGPEIARLAVYDRDRGFLDAETVLSRYEAPLRIGVELRSQGLLRSGGGAFMELEVSNAAGDRLATATVGFSGTAILENPQTGTYLYRAEAGTMTSEGGLHRFAARAGRDFQEATLGVDLTLSAERPALDPRLRPGGFLLMALGGVGFGLTLFRRRENPNSSPPKRRWGRG